MRFENSAVRILGVNNVAKPELEGGYVPLADKEQYAIELVNHDPLRRATATIVIDGVKVEDFRLDYANPSGSPYVWVIERNPSDHGRFTFFKTGTDAAIKVGEQDIAKSDKGLVEVTITHERNPRHLPVARPAVRTRGSDFLGATRGGSSYEGTAEATTTRGIPKGIDTPRYEAGVTGLTGHSDQQFATVAPLDLDTSKAYTFSFRLIVDNAASTEPRPMPGRRPTGNPVPPPIG